jgi:hypothetical protein
MKKFVNAAFILVLIVFFAGCNANPPSTTIPSSQPASTSPLHTTSPSITPSQAAKTSLTPNLTTPAITTLVVTTTVQPPARVSGQVYFRETAVVYPANVIPLESVLKGASVSVSGISVTSGASGNFDFPDVTPGYQTISVTKDGYIPATVSWDFSSGKSYSYNIGLYKKPAAVNPRPGFINGIITWDAGGWLIDYYYKQGLFQPTFTKAAANAGGNLVTVSDPLFITSATEDHVTMSTNSLSGSWWRMMNEAEYSVLVSDAHSRGLQFMLWIGTMDEGKTDYYKLVYSNNKIKDTFWNGWFSEYEKYAVPLARMAEKLGIEYINLGHDMGYAIDGYRFNGGDQDSLARWQKLISAIRAVYHGKLTYFGSCNVIDNYYEDNGYPAGFTNLFDAVGMNVQSISKTFNPTLAELKAGITTLLDRCKEWACPVFIMIRTPSVDGGTSFETYIEPLLVVNREADSHQMNVWQQSDIYEAFYEVVNTRPIGKGQVLGIFSWGYNYLDNYLSVPGKSDGAMAMDKSGNIRGKPAEAVMKFWKFNQ